MARRFIARNLARSVRSAVILAFVCAGPAWGQSSVLGVEPESALGTDASQSVAPETVRPPSPAAPAESSFAPPAPYPPSGAASASALAEEAPPTPPASPGRGSALPWIVLGLGGAGLALGAVAGIATIDKHSTLAAVCPAGYCPEGERGELDSYHALGTLSTVGFIVGSAVVMVGVVLFVAQGRLDRSTPSILAPLPRSTRTGNAALSDRASVGPGAFGILARF